MFQVTKDMNIAEIMVHGVNADELVEKINKFLSEKAE